MAQNEHVFKDIVGNIGLSTQDKYTEFVNLISNCIAKATPRAQGNRESVDKRGKDKSSSFITSVVNSSPWWNGDCEKLIRNVNQSYVWKKVKAFQSRWNSPGSGHEYKESSMERVKEAIDQLCPSWCRGASPGLENSNGDPSLDLIFSLEELDMAIKNVKLKSSPGMDGIDYGILQRLSVSVRQSLLILFNEIFSSRSFPVEWKNYSVFFIPKANSDKFRPIFMASCMLKTLERMVNYRLCWWVEVHHKLAPSQFGFRRQRSTLDNLSVLQAEVLQAFDREDCLAAIFLDIKGAYDNVLSEVLIERFKKKREVWRGLAQGGILSPILYAIYTAQLHSCLSQDSKVLEYADDVALYSANRDPRASIRSLEVSLTNVTEVFSQSGLQLAPEKCKLCGFSNDKKVRNKDWFMSVNGKVISDVKAVKFLGIIFDSGLEWIQQIEEIKKKCANPAAIIKYLRSVWWGAHPKVLLNLYRALVGSRIEYGAFLFCPLEPKLKLVLDRLQFSVVKIVMGYRKSTPTNLLLAEAKELPLDLRFKYLGLNYIARTFSLEHHPLPKLLEILNESRENPGRITKTAEPLIISCFKEVVPIGHLLFQSDKPSCYSFPLESVLIRANVSFDEGLKIKNSSNKMKTFLELFKEVIEQAECWFTDGSKSKGELFVGLASYRPKDEIKGRFRTSKYASIFTAEAMAIWQVLVSIKESSSEYFAIFSDSMSVLKALESKTEPWKKSTIIFSIKSLLLELASSNKQISFYWIPAHKGIVNNEIVDEMAKDSVINGRDCVLSIPSSDLKASWKEKIRSEFHNWCNETGKVTGINYFNNYYKESAYPRFHGYRFRRKSVVSINRLRSGHTSLATSLNRFNIVSCRTCKCGEFEEDENHIFWQCQRFSVTRECFIKDLVKVECFPPYSLEYCLHSMKRGVIEAIAKFINSIDISI
ncbi:uncharacterized protein [Chelonus insularis]|uniref:uncharacterized protein n=1 Tax=Chelonus insularis TaxID=460826 RepID=UPI00158D42C7|nr:uncharacterized protein LOC118064498 [Chelonus insularis]